MQATLQVNSAYTHLQEYGYRYEVVTGGAGSGKSYAVAQHIVLASMTPQNLGRKFLCVRKVARTLRNSVFALLRDIISEMGLAQWFRVNRSEMTLVSPIGVEIMMTGLDDVEKLKSVHGMTDIWIEEATELQRDDLRQLDLRLRGMGHEKRVVMTFNPILNTHWLKREFFDEPRLNARITKTTYKDNAFLDAEYRQHLEELKERSPYFYQVYTLGEWGVLGNVVFTDFVIEDFDYGPDDLESFGGGIDFGYNHPSAIVWAGMRDGEVYVFDEVYERKLTNADLVDVLRGIDQDKRWSYIADSAEPDRIEEFRRDGFNVSPAKKGKSSIKYGVDWLRQRRIHIHKTRCPHTAEEVMSYHYKEDRNGDTIDEPVDLNNHAIDALRYHFEEMWTGEVVHDFGWVIA
jgi:phage terminase large subunit